MLFVVASYELYVRRWGGGDLLLGLFLPPPLPTTIVRYTWVHAVGGGGARVT